MTRRVEFSLGWLGGPAERAFAGQRTGVDDLPWGTLDRAAHSDAELDLARIGWTASAHQDGVPRRASRRCCPRCCSPVRRSISSGWRAASSATRWCTWSSTREWPQKSAAARRLAGARLALPRLSAPARDRLAAAAADAIGALRSSWAASDPAAAAAGPALGWLTAADYARRAEWTLARPRRTAHSEAVARCGRLAALPVGDRSAGSPTLLSMNTIELDAAACARVFSPFPVPLRTLDALHLSAAEHIRAHGVAIDLASYDQRLCDAARALGFAIAEL